MAESMVIPGDIKRTIFIRQIGFLFSIAASVAIGVYVVLWSQTPNYSLLYGSLSDQDAGQVLETLQKANIKYRVDQTSGAVMVPSAQVHDARLKLASEGLPRSANAGFGMLQEEQGLGTSQFMEKARYQNALENELAKSISKISSVRSARVHLAMPKQSAFIRSRNEPSASIILNLYPGHRLELDQAAAIANLVAASVPNLNVNRVSIIDQNGRLMTHNQSSAELAITATQFQYARRVEESYIKRIEDILIPLLGPDGVKAQVTAEFDFTSSEQTRESFNPDMTTLRSEQIEEESHGGGRAAGIPGAISNKPPSETSMSADISNDNSGTGSMGGATVQKRSTRNYELDKTISHTRMPMGSLRRLSVAVIVDHKQITDDKGNISRVEHSPEELERITSLVKEAVGFNSLRGDHMNVINAKFVLPEIVVPLPEDPVWKQPWVWDIAKQALGGLFVLLLVFGVLRPSLKNLVNKEMTLQQAALAGPAGELSAPGGQQGGSAQQLAGSGQTPQLTAPGGYDNTLSAVRNIVKEDPKSAAQVVRNWVGED
ncbi:MAG: flagellar basal-body MS-ring/collar protein FliF [Gammaproteobacteria bacterium]